MTPRPSFTFDKNRANEIHPIGRANISREARLMTDEAKMYKKISREFAEHGTTLHGLGNYVDRTDATIHANTVEGTFSIFKRGMKGVYQHYGEQHLHRYLAEFEFRYNTPIANGFDNKARSTEALRGIVGKRLTYARPDIDAYGAQGEEAEPLSLADKAAPEIDSQRKAAVL
jgi:hypothetical protein